MAPRTLTLDDTARTVAAIDQALDFERERPILIGISGRGKARPPFLPAVEAMLGNAVLRSALENLRADRDRLADRYADLLTAAQAAVIEARTSHRNPLTPVREALAELDEMPAAGVRLRDLPLPATAAWPVGSEVES